MSWADFYLGCFVFGLALTALSFFGGLGHLHLGHFHVGHVAKVHAHGRGSLSPVNLFTVTAFLCWFGGLGYLLTRQHAFAVWMVLAVSVAAGMASATLVFLFFARVLLPHERALVPEDTEMRGVVARVSMPLRSTGPGEIIFTLNGTRRSAPARAEGERTLARGTEVLVTHYERGVAWVEPFQSLETLDRLERK